MKIPANLAKVADMYKLARDARLAMEKKAEQLKIKEVELKQHLINNLPKSQVGGISGQIARVEVVKKEMPYIEDRDKFFKHVKRSGETELVTQSLNPTAVKERWESGKKVPGVSKHVVVTISLHSIKSQRKSHAK